ncbi:MAG: hypothetical protein QM396_01720 [Euryarchaeota archaeon]|jgi:hypothetical protein|uniref:hypothetical protein n=1 Tax=Methanobacterium sp. MZD130B TaxID=3394378 RepID=UPI001757B0B7|nr:hypothetical protein [Euryarchaeota archaeon]HHT19074.1 hypothetical protein [Methanobacterium sp.]
MKIKEYQKLIQELSDIDLEANSIADSRRILAELNERENIVAELIKRVKKDIQNIELDFLEKKHKINVDYAEGRSSGVISRVRGKSKVKELKKLQEKRDETLESYHAVRYILDELYIQIKDAKDPLNNYIKGRLGGL